jgi:hypothetical protein
MECGTSNAAVAANWVSTSNVNFRTDEGKNSLVEGSYWAAAASYVSSSALNAFFYSTYEGSDALEILRQRNIEQSVTPADPLFATEEKVQADLLRCIIGNPFRPSSPLPLTVLTWNGGTVVKLAQAIYEERAFERLPVLADALEEAGLADTDILAHCRGPGPHVRGCFLVDLLLGKD